MAYIKIDQGAVVDGPLTAGEVKQRWPNTSFEKNNVAPPEDGWVALGRPYRPELNEETETLDAFGYAELDGEWRAVYSKRPKTAEEIAQDEAGLADMNRGQRNTLLAKSDYTQLADYPNPDKALWATYRQQLRDIPAQAGFPRTVTFPDKPGQMRDEL